jgi:hypothetical protein
MTLTLPTLALTVDGHEVRVPRGAMLLEFPEESGLG